MKMQEPKRIKQLSNLVANQIAAGEVVDRPAAVLKELLENSIDAGATNIEITITNGGSTLIKVQDDGIGILKEDLALAFLQHATSKISTITDLENINSLGFRGEALASISAVSNMTIISKPAAQIYAYKAELTNTSACNIEPYSHPNGTTVCMQDLFYNIPARKKFLRRERTEFLHLEDLFKRIALSNFKLGLKFNYNQKVLYNLKPCIDMSAKERRVAELCGKYFMQHNEYINIEQNGMHLYGWLGLPKNAKAYADCQYFFINDRLVRDRLIVNTIRKAYKDYIDASKHPMYCLYLNLSPNAVDVNVHPTKAEVRFREANVVFFFLLQVINDIFKNKPASNSTSNAYKMQANNLITTYPKQILCILENKVIVLQKEQSLQLINIHKLRYQVNLLKLQQEFSINKKITAVPFMEPYTITSKLLATRIMLFRDLLFNMGLDCNLIGEDVIIMRGYPKDLEIAEDLEMLLLDTTNMLSKAGSQDLYKYCAENIFPVIAKSIANNTVCNETQAANLLQAMNFLFQDANTLVNYAAEFTAANLIKLID